MWPSGYGNCPKLESWRKLGEKGRISPRHCVQMSFGGNGYDGAGMIARHRGGDSKRRGEEVGIYMKQNRSLRRSLMSVAVVAPSVDRSSAASLAPARKTPRQRRRAAAFPANCTVYASGLLNPRYLTVGADGTVYVTEAAMRD